MARQFDSGPIFDSILSYWRDYYKDHDRFSRFWEAAARLMDDEYAQAEQVNDSSSVQTCPTNIYHTYLYRKLEDWKSYNVPHEHFRKDFRAAAGQMIFYVGDWPDPESLQIFVDGKEVDVIADPFVLTYDQDATQPSVNPEGARLIFSNPMTAGTPVSVFSDYHRIHIEREVPPGGLSSITFPANVDPDSVRVVLKKVNITRFLTITANSFKWAVLPTSTGMSDSRLFRRGESYEIADGAVRQTVAVPVDASSVSIPIPVVPATAVVYRILNFDASEGKLSLEGKSLISKEQDFPVSVVVRVSDFYGSMGIETTVPTKTIVYDRAADPESYKAFMYSGQIAGGYQSGAASVRFERSFMEGVVILIEANLVTDNDHAEYRQVIPVPTNQASVPMTRPFALGPVWTEQSAFPVQFFVNGILMPPDTYTFLSSTTVQLSAAAMPAGSVVDFYYVDLENPAPHLHVREEFRITVPTAAFHLVGFVSDLYSRYVSVSGAEVSDPTKREFRFEGTYLAFTQRLPTGSLLRIRGAHFSYPYYHDIDVELVSAAYLQNGIDQQATTMPAGWTIQLPWDDGFLVTKGLLESNAKIEDAWFVDALIDEKTAYGNFGNLIDFSGDTSDEYVRILRALFGGNYLGSRPEILENFSCVILGSEYLGSRAKIEQVTPSEVTTVSETLALDQDLPVRVEAGKTYNRFYAVSSFVRVHDDWAAFDALAMMGSEFSEDYTYARTLDVHKPTQYLGGASTYDRPSKRLYDPITDFMAEEVWPGDLVAAYLTPAGTPQYGRITEVGLHFIGVELDLASVRVGYGQKGYGRYGYGAGASQEQVDHYKIWNRVTDKIDTWKHLDEAAPEDIPYLSSRLHDLLSPFVFLVEIRWNAVRDANALENVLRFLDRSKPHDTRYLAYTRFLEGELEDAFGGTLEDDDPVVTEVPAFAFVSSVPEVAGFIGVNGAISPNVGSFIGV